MHAAKIKGLAISGDEDQSLIELPLTWTADDLEEYLRERLPDLFEAIDNVQGELEKTGEDGIASLRRWLLCVRSKDNGCLPVVDDPNVRQINKLLAGGLRGAAIERTIVLSKSLFL